ncbi:MAG: hypothetical protein WCY92_15065 [Novosphingobium sp.]
MIVLWLALYAAASMANAFWLRQRFAICQRMNDVNWRILTLIDEVGAFAIFTPLYVLGLFPRMPMVGDTISSLAWAGELAGVRWCAPLRIAIDALFRLLTSQRHHCHDAWAKWADPMAASA